MRGAGSGCLYKFVLQANWALKDQVRVDIHQEKLYDKVSTKYIPFWNKIWSYQLTVIVPAAVLLVEGEVKELALYLPGYGGL